MPSAHLMFFAHCHVFLLASINVTVQSGSPSEIGRVHFSVGTRFTGGGVHVPSRIDGADFFGW